MLKDFSVSGQQFDQTCPVLLKIRRIIRTYGYIKDIFDVTFDSNNWKKSVENVSL